MLFRFRAGLPIRYKWTPERTGRHGPRHPWSLARMEDLGPLMETLWFRPCKQGVIKLGR